MLSGTAEGGGWLRLLLVSAPGEGPNLTPYPGAGPISFGAQQWDSLSWARTTSHL